MSKEENANATVCKQRFKGLENFLKRIAFNLGNTPSQTEVKIISCIPIDVTDLQQKIINLEKQLEEANGNAPGTPPSEVSKTSKASKTNKSFKFPKIGKSAASKRTTVNTVLIDSNFSTGSTAATSCEALDRAESTSPTCWQNKNKSNVSFIFAPLTNDTALTVSNDNSVASERPQPIPELNNIATNHAAPKMCERKQNDNRRKFFKIKNFLKHKKGKLPCVYYAQTTGCPFNRSEIAPNYESSDLITRSYLVKMINKQYKPKLLGDNLSTVSQFSSPICRDVQSHCDVACRYESDIFSCCHGPFHNIDDYINKAHINYPQTYMVNEINTGNAYYDTNQYDLVPVKEKPVKMKKDLEMPRKKDLKPHIDIKCCPENVRTKFRYHPLYPLPTSNHYNGRPRADYTTRDKQDNCARKMPQKINRIEPTATKVAKRAKEIYKRERSINIETSKSCSIDFGSVYTKKSCKRPKKQESLQPIPVPVSKKNAECLTTAINNSECQTVMCTVEADSANAKTEATLNQIKSILRSVLEEVKVSSQTKSQVIQNKPKKDAVVQKGPSHNNMQASSLMNSITFSPYAMNPAPYVASCSRQLNPSQFYYPHVGMKYFPNFPLFVQNPGRHVCTSCYRNSSHIKSGYMKQPRTIATNTDEVQDRGECSKERDKLIKEIYKSMALTMDLPNKDSSLSEYDEMMKSLNGFTTPIILKTEPKKQPKKIKNVVQAVSELFMKKDIVDTSDTPNSIVESKVPPNETSTGTQMATTTDTTLRMRKDRFNMYIRPKNSQPAEAKVEQRTFQEAMVQNTSESEASSSETDSDITVFMAKESLEPKHKKEGLFSKMFKSVFKPKDKIKKRGEKIESEEETISDSDDYQTVYSLKIEKTPRNRRRPHNLPRRKTHSKISYKQTYQRDRSPEKKRSPYMEQEYRRYWNEKLMFHNNRLRHSSDQIYSVQTAPQKSAYNQTYETRSAFVEPKTHVPKTECKLRDNDDDNKLERKSASKGLAWLKNHKVGIHCGEQWKKLLLEG